MNEDTLNMEIRKFLKKVGITSQREIEKAVAKGIENGSLSGSENIAVSVQLESSVLGLSQKIEGNISLE